MRLALNDFDNMYYFRDSKAEQYVFLIWKPNNKA